MKNRIFAFFCCVVVLFCSVVLPAGAVIVGDDGLNSIAVISALYEEDENKTLQDYYEGGSVLFVTPIGGYSAYTNVLNAPIYSMFYVDHTGPNGDICVPVLASPVPGVSVLIYRKVSSQYRRLLYTRLDYVDEETGLFYWPFNSDQQGFAFSRSVIQDQEDYFSNMGIALTIDDVLSSIRQKLDSGTLDPSRRQVSIPAGYGAIIRPEVPNSSFTVTTRVPDALVRANAWGNTSLFPSAYYSTNTNIFSDGSIVSLPRPSDTLIPWQGAGNPDLNGRYSTAVWSQTISGAHVGYFICNPLFTYSDYINWYSDSEITGIGGVLNNSLSVSMTGFSSNVTIFPLSTTMGNSFDSGQLINEDISYQGDATSAGTVWRDDTGAVTELPIGGSTDISGVNSDGGFFSWINSIVDKITGIFTWSHDAIRNIVDAGSAFISQLSSLYMWLPSSVLSVLTSALILAIAIGVIKVLL